ncbi:MAG: hypothetical protein ABID54_09995 [Pseudomonadota bacterium]
MLLTKQEEVKFTEIIENFRNEFLESVYEENYNFIEVSVSTVQCALETLFRRIIDRKVEDKLKVERLLVDK